MKQFVITASIASLVERGEEADQELIYTTSPVYNPQTVEDVLQPGATSFLVYRTSKGLADHAVHDFKRTHPDLDATTIHPLYVYGLLGSGQVYNAPATGTNQLYLLAYRGCTGPSHMCLPLHPVGGL